MTAVDQVFMERGGILLIATRNRPDEISGLLSAIRSAGDCPPAAVMIDGSPEPYIDVEWPSNWSVHVSPGQRELVASFNELFRLHPEHAFYVLAADHARPRTSGWFERLGGASGDWGIAYSRDGVHDGRWPNGDKHLTGGVALGGKLAHAMGWIFCPHMIHDSVDRVLEDIANRFDLWRWCPDVLVESERIANTDRRDREYLGIPYPETDFLARRIWEYCTRVPTFKRIEEAMRADGL